MWKLLELLGFIFEYQTPRVVTIRHYKLGIFRLILQMCILTFIFVFQLWYKKDYQAFSEVEASVTTKVKYLIHIILDNLYFVEKYFIFLPVITEYV